MLLTFINWAVSGEFAESTQHFLKCLITCVFLCFVCTPRSRTHFVSSPNLSPLQIFENLRMHLLLPACVCAHGGMFWSWTGDPVHAKQVFNQWAVFSALLSLDLSLGDRISLSCPGWIWAFYVAQEGLELPTLLPRPCDFNVWLSPVLPRCGTVSTPSTSFLS